jgi:hypothetical protein
MSIPVPSGMPAPDPAERDLHLAWWSVAAVPVAFVLAMFAGEGLISMLGYDPS